MSDVKKQLAGAAIEIANKFGRKKLASEKAQAHIALELQQEKAAGEAAGIAFKRGADFRVTVGTDYQCPRCWVAQGIETPLIPQPSDTAIDEFMCRICHFEFSL